MKAGRLDRLITIQVNDVVDHPITNEEISSWKNISENPVVWAQKVVMSGGENFEAEKLTAMNVSIFRIRYRIDLSAEMRVIDENGDIFYITSVREATGSLLSSRRPRFPTRAPGRREITELKTEIRD